MSRQKRSVNSFALGLLASLQGTLALAETTSAVAGSPATTVTATAPAPAAAKIYGMLDTRPSLTMTGTNAYMENAIEVGYKFTPNVQLTYLQAFDNNLADTTKQGIGLKVWDGFFRMRVRNILQSEDKSLSLSYQGRLYLPTDKDEQAKGEITTLRTYLSLTKKFSSVLTMGVHEVPILHAYSKAGINGRANKAPYENMFMVDSNIQVYGPVYLYFPVVFNVATYQNFASGAVNNNASAALVYIYPELGIAISDNHTVGLSYYSGNLVKSDLSASTISAGLDAGVAQLFWTATL